MDYIDLSVSSYSPFADRSFTFIGNVFFLLSGSGETVGSKDIWNGPALQMTSRKDMTLKNSQFDEYTTNIPDVEVLQESSHYFSLLNVLNKLWYICNGEFPFQLLSKFTKKYLTQSLVMIFDEVMISLCRILAVKCD